MKSLDQLKTKLLKNPQTREEYDALAGEFETARELIAASEEHQASPEHADGAALRLGGERGRRGADYEQYITVQEAAERLNRPEPVILRMLEVGALPAMLRADLVSKKDGSPIGFDFARLPIEGVRRVIDQGGDDFTLEWEYCGGHGKAICFPAKISSIRILWEPSIFPELMPQSKDNAQVGVDAKAARGTPPALTPEQKGKAVQLYDSGRGESVKKLAEKFNTSRRTIDAALCAAGVKKVTLRKERSTHPKTVRKP